MHDGLSHMPLRILNLFSGSLNQFDGRSKDSMLGVGLQAKTLEATYVRFSRSRHAEQQVSSIPRPGSVKRP